MDCGDCRLVVSVFYGFFDNEGGENPPDRNNWGQLPLISQKHGHSPHKPLLRRFLR